MPLIREVKGAGGCVGGKGNCVRRQLWVTAGVEVELKYWIKNGHIKNVEPNLLCNPWTFGPCLPILSIFPFITLQLFYQMKVQKGTVINSTVVDRASPSTDKVAIINLHTTQTNWVCGPFNTGWAQLLVSQSSECCFTDNFTPSSSCVSPLCSQRCSLTCWHVRSMLMHVRRLLVSYPFAPADSLSRRWHSILNWDLPAFSWLLHISCQVQFVLFLSGLDSCAPSCLSNKNGSLLTTGYCQCSIFLSLSQSLEYLSNQLFRAWTTASLAFLQLHVF